MHRPHRHDSRHRRTLALAMAFGGLCWPLAAGLMIASRTALAEETNRPNIVFIMSDDHGYQAMSCYGSRVNQTPNLDRIATEGMRFDRCFVTNSICGPSRAVILTGKYSHLNGFARNGDRFNGDQPNVAKLLQANGYQTAVIGKWHLATEPTGFDYYHILQGQGPYYNPVMLTPEGRVDHTGYTTDIITDETLRWLRDERNPDLPFFLMYQHKAPHRNWQPGPDQLNNYDDVEIPEPDTLFDDYSGRGSAARLQRMTIANDLSPHDLKLVAQQGRFTPEQLEAWEAAYAEENQAFEEANLQGEDRVRWMYQRYVKDYLRCIDAVDENVGRVLDYLDEAGIAENTIVIYTSDQGWYLGEHGWYDKRWMYEESFRTPLLVRWPRRVAAGSTCQEMVMNLDFAQTFLDVAGVRQPDDMQGRSIAPLLDGEVPEDWRKSVYYHYYEFPGPHSVHRHYGVRTERYKLIHFYELDEWELYDLVEDPQEMNSAYDDPRYADVVREMRSELTRLRELYGDDGTVVDFDAEQARQVELRQALAFSSELSTPLEGEVAFSVPSSPELDPALKPLLVGGWLRPLESTGTLVAHGGQSQGYALFLDEGRLGFVVRANGVASRIDGPELAAGEWTHVAAQLDVEGRGTLLVNGVPVGEPEEMNFVRGRPADGLTIGIDGGSTVVDADTARGLRGEVRDLRVYEGSLDEESLSLWTIDPFSQSLFNGEDLSGWRIIDQNFFDKHGDVAVEDGTILLGAGQPATGIVFDGTPPRINYELTLEAKRIDGSDFFCGLTFPVDDDYLSLIIGGWGGGVTGVSNLDGMSAVENETTGYEEFEQNRWYRIRLRVTDRRIEAWVDERQIIGLTTHRHRYSIWWEQEPARPLGVVSWNSTAALRHLRLRSLD